MTNDKLFWPGDPFKLPHHGKQFKVPAGEFTAPSDVARRLLLRYAIQGMTRIVDALPVSEQKAASRAQLAAHTSRRDALKRNDDAVARPSYASVRRAAAGKVAPGRISGSLQRLPPPPATPTPPPPGPAVRPGCSNCGQDISSAPADVALCDACAVAGATADAAKKKGASEKK